jgi:Tfp pilus assembly protein FimV
LEANVPSIQRLKILIHGQEVETLAGHLDLTGTFLVNTKGIPTAHVAAAPSPVTPTPAQKVAPVAPPGGDKPATPAATKPATTPNSEARSSGVLRR